jgi:5'-phosphate synthase pdxT subunit
MSLYIGILSLQGDFPKHEEAFRRLEVRTRQVRTESDLAGLSGLVIPGGESTTLSRLLIPASAGTGFVERLRDFANAHPVWGTCAGMILLCKDAGDPRVTCLGLLDVEVVRNGYGRQVHSFETDLAIPCLNEKLKPFRGVFIRAPRVTKVGPDVEVLARLDDSRFRGEPVMLRRGNLLATGFHPELTDDLRVQQYFLSMF